MQHWELFRSNVRAAPRSDVGYFRKRAIQEQVAARNATCPTARKLHEEMAAMYLIRVSLLSDPWSEAGVAIALQRLTLDQSTAGVPTPA